MQCTLLVFELIIQFDYVVMWLCLCRKAVLQKNVLLFLEHSTSFCPLSFLWLWVHFSIQVLKLFSFPSFPLKSPAIRIADVDRCLRLLLMVARHHTVVLCVELHFSVFDPCTLIVVIKRSIRSLSGELLFFYF